jgi:hypothetical protein
VEEISMFIDINGRLIVNNFKTILPSITFIPSTDHPEIIANLDILGDTSIKKGKYIKFSRSKKQLQLHGFGNISLPPHLSLIPVILGE